MGHYIMLAHQEFILLSLTYVTCLYLCFCKVVFHSQMEFFTTLIDGSKELMKSSIFKLVDVYYRGGRHRERNHSFIDCLVVIDLLLFGPLCKQKL